MFRPPFLARVAAGAAVYALEETRRLPSAAIKFPITAISQILQTGMHLQQFVTSLALKGDAVFDRLVPATEEQPEWATFDEDLDAGQSNGNDFSGWASRFDLHAGEESSAVNGRTGSGVTAVATGFAELGAEPAPTASDTAPADTGVEAELTTETAAAEPEVTEPEVTEPEVARRYNYADMTLAQLRARLRMLSLDELTTLLDYEQRTLARAPFVTMLTNRIATVQAQ
ncbi:lipid droplet-associated protein [Nocardia higoensis]|uniref:Lipid droplet-associated protein n=1 Tax=Nocardia higoensis TaxID=228599 RepID=A0ABS0DA89_9NOCA|nr:lipid droplet-associated protein [Nocardia higoensis]MBF6355365.1 lipid droplet-associated protein [Nocardia higoensis]